MRERDGDMDGLWRSRSLRAGADSLRRTHARVVIRRSLQRALQVRQMQGVTFCDATTLACMDGATHANRCDYQA